EESWRSPAMDAEEASSANRPSWATRRYAARMSRSLTARISPPDSAAAFVASSHEAGLPMRMAVAMVDGLGTGRPSTMGAAPAAWNPNMTGAMAIWMAYA